MCGPNFCSMKITQDIRDYASKHNIKDIKIAVEKGMKEKSDQFAASGNKIYIKNSYFCDALRALSKSSNMSSIFSRPIDSLTRSSAHLQLSTLL